MKIVLNIDMQKAEQSNLFNLMAHIVTKEENVACIVEGYMPTLTMSMTFDTTTADGKTIAKAVFSIITWRGLQTLAVEDNPFTVAEIEAAVAQYAAIDNALASLKTLSND